MLTFWGLCRTVGPRSSRCQKIRLCTARLAGVRCPDRPPSDSTCPFSSIMAIAGVGCMGLTFLLRPTLASSALPGGTGGGSCSILRAGVNDHVLGRTRGLCTDSMAETSRGVLLTEDGGAGIPAAWSAGRGLGPLRRRAFRGVHRSARVKTCLRDPGRPVVPGRGGPFGAVGDPLAGVP